MARVFVGHDWAEAHHDVFVEDEQGRRLGGGRLSEGVDGVAQFHALVADHVEDPAEVVVATETDRGLFVGSMIAAGYTVFAVNPLSVSRYRERHSTSGAKSDPGDAKVLAELARTDHQNHRPIAGDSELVESLKVLTRGHQSLIWTRQRQLNQLRSTLREFYPAALGRHRRWVGSCRSRGSPQRSSEAVVNDGSRHGPARSRPLFAATSSPLQTK